MKHLSGEYYDGLWQDNVPHGHALAIHANGDSYEGEWRSGIPHGRGATIDCGMLAAASGIMVFSRVTS